MGRETGTCKILWAMKGIGFLIRVPKDQQYERLAA